MSAYSLELAEFSIAAIAITAITAYAIYWTLNDSPISRWLHDSDAVVPSFLSITSLFSVLQSRPWQVIHLIDISMPLQT